MREIIKPNSNSRARGHQREALDIKQCAFTSARQKRSTFLFTLFLPILFVACATRPLPGRDWESPIDLHFTYDSFNNVNLDLTCESRSKSGVLTVAKSPICKSIAIDIASHGAITAEERARSSKDTLDLDDKSAAPSTPIAMIPLTLEITTDPTTSEGCGLLTLPTLASLGVIPCSSIRTTPIDIRILDQQGIAVESHRILQMERRAYGSTALITLIGGKGRREHRESNRRMIHFIENRVYAAALRSNNPKPRAAVTP